MSTIHFAGAQTPPGIFVGFFSARSDTTYYLEPRLKKRLRDRSGRIWYSESFLRKGGSHMASTGHPDKDRCFVLTNIRVVGARPRSVVIESISGRDLTAITAPRTEPGSSVQLDLGEQGWVDGVVRWTGDGQLGLRLQDDIQNKRLFELEN